jgi:hypothetical protein
MDRVTKTAVVTGFLCVLLLAVAAAIDGYLHGAGSRRQHPPGFEGTVLNVLIVTVFYGLTVWGIGAIAGAGAAAVGIAIDCRRGDRR